MRRLGRNFRQRNPAPAKTLSQKVAAILRKYGTDAHVYLPGIGVINGLTAGNYLDSAGATPATVDNPVGLVLDGNNTIGAEGLTNGDFSSGLTGWSNLSIGTGTAVVINNALVMTGTNSSNRGTISQSFTTVIGKSYVITFTVVANTGSTVIAASNSSGASFGLGFTTTDALARLQFVATATTTFVNIYTSLVASCTLDNISVKEVTGIHAIQATTANKPVLRRGAVNLLTYSKQFANAAWTRRTGVVITQNSTSAPNGTTTAETIDEGAEVSTNHDIYRTSIVQGPGTFTYSVYAKNLDGQYVNLAVASSSTNYVGVIYNLSTGAVASSASLGTYTLNSSSITAVGNGWYRCVMTFASASSVAGGLNIAMANSTIIGNFGITTYTGTNRKIYIWGAQLQTGSVATDYVPTTTAAASSPTGNYWWKFADSTDLLTATFPTGYESATTIDARNTGQVTLTAQNIVGAYNIGPSIDTYGRFVFRTALTASELATMQQFANRSAGV